jgi:DNA-binding winged helix-turn-helix (wHTH) protein/TolB-like protein/Flp pilus assembly protein TadD
MRAPTEAVASYRFGPYRLDLGRQELCRGDEPVPLTPKAFDTLRVLVEANGAVVAKERLLQEVWRDKFVEESVLTQNVYTLRKVLGDGDAGSAYIVTVPKRGYRLAVPVEVETAEPAAGGEMETVTPPGPAVARETPADGGGAFAPAGPAAPAAGAAPATATRVRRRPRAALAAVALGILVVVALGFRSWRAAHRPLPIESLAVLPVVALHPGADDELLELAMADALITRLSALEPLVVRPTSAVQDLGSGPRDPLQIGRRLDVDAVMDGSLQRSGDRLRLSLRLLSVRDGRLLWSGSFETVYTDPFTVQDAISVQVADALALQLSGRRQQRGNRGTNDRAAYQEYVRGRYFWNRRTEPDLMEALRHFQSALDRDPTFAAAHAGVADTWALLPLYGRTSPRDAFPKAIKAARDALSYDPDLAEAHTSLAYSRFQYEWDWEESEAEFRTAMRLDPSYPTAPHWYAYLLSALGRHEEAIANARLAQRLDPLSLVINTDLGLVLYFARRHDDAVAQFRRTLELDPRFAYARFGAALALSAANRHDEAIVEARRAVELSGGSALMRGVLGHVLGRAGRVDEAREVLAALSQVSPGGRVQPGAFVLVHTGLGDGDAAFAALRSAYDERSRFMVYLDVWPIYDDIRTDRRFASLIQAVALPPRRRPVSDPAGTEGGS